MQALNPQTLPLHGRQLIEASAGTGKTYTITTLYLRAVVESHKEVRQILVVTFTRAATDELRNRIRERLHSACQALHRDTAAASGEDDGWNWLRESAERAHLQFATEASNSNASDTTATALEKTRWRLQQAILEMDTAAIYTIHGFCQRALQDHAFDSGVLFDTSLEQDTSQLLQQACQQVWRDMFYAQPVLSHTAYGLGYRGPDDLQTLLKGYLNKTDLLIPEIPLNLETLQQQAQALKQAWQQQGTEALALVREAAAAKTISASAKTYGAENLDTIAAQLKIWALNNVALTLPKSADLLGQSRLQANLLKGAVKKGLSAPEHALFQHLDAYLDEAAGLAPWLLVTLLTKVKHAFANLKQQRHLMGFDDLITRLRDALQGTLGPQLSTTLHTRYPLAMIDEFQDTDPAQYAIFNAIYPAQKTTSELGLLMIGDPKQAIYSFRGADIFAYLQAKQDTGSVYTMDTNWRSHSQLIEAVNQFFASHPDPFLLGSDIEFFSVKAAGQANRTPLTLEGTAITPVQCWFWARDSDEQKKNLDKKQVVPVIAATVASEVAHWINLGATGDAKLGEQALQPGDMALLVRKGTEALTLQEALQACGVASVFLSRESVYDSTEAQDLQLLMQALLEPGNESRVRAALVMHCWGYNANRLEQLAQDDRAWEALLQELLLLRQDWQRFGFMVMFQRWLHQYQIPARLLAQAQGDRALTNLLHLAGLLQAAHREHSTPEALNVWFRAQLQGASGQQDEHQLRLESDDDLVKIVTIHSAKGLEYPIVYCPFIGLGSDWPRAPFCLHDPNRQNRLVLDFGDLLNSVGQIEGDSVGLGEAAQARANLEARAEDLRLLYVALTRAKQHLVFPWGAFKQMQNTAMAWLLYGDTPPTDDASVFAPLIALADKTPGLACISLPEAVHVRESTSQNPPRLAALPVTKPVRQHWYQSSYSQLARHSSDNDQSQGAQSMTTRAEELDENRHGNMDLTETRMTAEKTLLSFTAGSQSGLCLHSILEDIDFTATTAELFDPVIEKHLNYYQLGSEWTQALQQGIWEVLHTPLTREDPDFCLHRVDAQNKIVEMEFFLPVENVTASRVNQFIAGLWQHQDPVSLDFHRHSGQLHGFIDLVFRYRGRFYVVDYKSNKLGSQKTDYDQDNMVNAIREHRYDLQYLIYALALHRYLESRLPDYDYQSHFGGVYYLFLRGMRGVDSLSEPTDSHVQETDLPGVYYYRPSQMELSKFADILQAGRS